MPVFLTHYPPSGEKSRSSLLYAGHSRGGFWLEDPFCFHKRGIPLAVKITAGQVHDSTQLENVHKEIHIPRIGKGRPECKPARVAADKAYSCTRIRRYLISRAIKTVIPRKSNEPDGRERFDIGTYKNRNVVERSIGWIKESQRNRNSIRKSGNRFYGNGAASDVKAVLYIPTIAR
jgi:hypothetical protein